MPKQIKILVGSLIVGIATLTLTTGAAIAEDTNSNQSGCGCCKKMQQPMPHPPTNIPGSMNR